tara:strand:+ start:839 stop:1033 length:195 start_codon:yes stop_codon:yes gene_type:complete
MNTFSFTDEELECIRVCVSNSPIPYDITLKQIPKKILDKIGEPKSITEDGLPLIKLDLTRYEHE